MDEVNVGILWIIWMLNVDLFLVDSIGKLSRSMVELWSSVSEIMYILCRVILDANHSS